MEKQEPDLISPEWQRESKLIGYGLDSLVFHPPFFLPHDQTFPLVAELVRQRARGFVGLITTHEHWNKSSRTTNILKQLVARNSDLARLTVLPVSLIPGRDFLCLADEQIVRLVTQHHAVRKKVDYEGTWKRKKLVQVIYPYAGLPLERLCNQPESPPSWNDFFAGMREVTRFIITLHAEGYVHGDLSPNNLLYDPNREVSFTIIDWNMLCPAQEFLEQKKGLMRVGSWSPEHFSLTTERLQEMDVADHWQIYSGEMQNYVRRLISFSGSLETQQSLDLYFKSHVEDPLNPDFKNMHIHLQRVAYADPSSIGKYHDVRYLCDTIAKVVQAIYPAKNKTRQSTYNSFLALLLTQNLPERSIYLEEPGKLLARLCKIFDACRNEDVATTIYPSERSEAEAAIFRLLQQWGKD